MWTDEDHDLALAHEEVLAAECGGCGSPLAETTDPANQRAYTAESVVCFKCEARERAQAIEREEARESGLRTFGVKWYVTESGLVAPS